MEFVMRFVPSGGGLFSRAEELMKEFGLSANPEKVPEPKVMAKVREYLHSEEVDVFFVKQGWSPKAAFFDMDSTIVAAETLDEMAVKASELPGFEEVGKRVAEITEQAMAEGLDFDTSLRKRLSMLEGVDAESLLEPVYKDMKLNPGAEELIATLKSHGVKCVLVSGGFSYFTEKVAAQLGMDAHHGNDLEIDESGKLTGRVLNDDAIVNGARKEHYLREYAQQWGIEPADCLAVGDGSNDIPMMKAAGLGLGYRPAPKKKVEQEIPNIIRYGRLETVLGALNMSPASS